MCAPPWGNLSPAIWQPRPSEVITGIQWQPKRWFCGLNSTPLAIAAHHHRLPVPGTSPLPRLPASFPTVLLSCPQALSALPPHCCPSFLPCGHSCLPWVDLKEQRGSQKPLLSPETELCSSPGVPSFGPRSFLSKPFISPRPTYQGLTQVPQCPKRPPSSHDLLAPGLVPPSPCQDILGEVFFHIHPLPP